MFGQLPLVAVHLPQYIKGVQKRIPLLICSESQRVDQAGEEAAQIAVAGVEKIEFVQVGLRQIIDQTLKASG